MSPSQKSVNRVAKDRRIEGSVDGFSSQQRTYVSPSATVLLSRAARSILKLPRPMKRLIMMGADAIILPIAFWVALPWSTKMVAGVASDVHPILGSRRLAYLLLGRQPRTGQATAPRLPTMPVSSGITFDKCLLTL